MKKILIRSGLSPLDSPSMATIINRNLIGGNAGNLIYANSVYRTLMINENTELICDNYSMNADDADWINENCSAYIIPLADLFRESAQGERGRIKNLVKKLNIPCIILGVGIRAKSVKEIENGFSFDDDVKDFMNAILEKSAMVGLRGELTAKYLTGLGYKEDKDFMVIGCPSMFTFGAALKRREGPIRINQDSLLSVNASVVSTKENINYVLDLLENYKNSVFIPQRQGELITLYTGKVYEHPCNKPMYPIDITHPLYAENRVKMFLQAKQWIDFLETRDLSIGCRMHGNIAAILAGTPTVIIPHDMRMRELIEYHKLPHILPKDLFKCGDLSEALSKVDFDAMFTHHQENFERYGKFLKINNIDNIFSNTDSVEVAPYDIALDKIHRDFEVHSVAFASKEETMGRMIALYDDSKEVLYDEKEKTARYKVQFNTLNKASTKKLAKCLTVKVTNRIKGVRKTNFEIISTF